MDDFDDLVDEAERVPIGGWDFGWLDGRAVEERPTWRYFDRVAERAGDVWTLLEVQAGAGSMIGMLPSLPRLSVATEGFPASVALAAPRLRSRGVHLVVTSQDRPGLPFADETFQLVVSRHPIEVWWRRAPPHGLLRHRCRRLLPSARALDRPRVHGVEVSGAAPPTPRDHQAPRRLRDEGQQNTRRSDQASVNLPPTAAGSWMGQGCSLS